jgi:hypothetical protein
MLTKTIRHTRDRVGTYWALAWYGWFFVRAYLLLARANQLIASGGLRDAERVLLHRRWKVGRPPPAAKLERLERAILEACRWQVRETNCFPRALTTYVMLRRMGVHATLRIGVRARPFAGHAWVEVNGAAVADTLTAEDRSALRVVIILPHEQLVEHRRCA